MDFKCDKNKVFTSAELRLIKDALYVLGGKWKLDVIRSLAAGNTRFTEIRKSLPEINTRMLSIVLKELEANHIIERKTFDEFPPVTIYTFTAHSKRLEPILYSLIEWAEMHREKIFNHS